MPQRLVSPLKVPTPPQHIEELVMWAKDLTRELERYARAQEELGTDTSLLGSVMITNLAAGFTISPDAYVVEINVTGNVTSDATTTIKNGINNQIIILHNRSNFDVTIKHNANTKLNADVDHTLKLNSMIAFRWDGTDWIELYRSRHPGVTA